MRVVIVGAGSAGCVLAARLTALAATLDGLETGDELALESEHLALLVGFALQSMGKAGDETDNGIYLVSDKHDHIIMDSSTYGVPVNSSNGYRTPVDYATRMSYSGIFFHSAPWSVWAQGNTNTSHGCLNLSPENALWVMENTLRGDPVIVKNTTGGTLSGTDGLGDWNIPWETWKAGNADRGA